MTLNAFFRWVGLPVLLVFLFLANLSIGSVAIPIADIVSIVFGNEAADPVWKNIVWDFRITKALTCVIAGSALSVSGLQMQTLFRNALAGPDVLGITSGASLAVSLTFMANPTGVHNPWAVTAAASVGAILVFFVMLAFSRNLRDNVSLLIVGLMTGAAASSIISVLQFASNAEDIQTYLIWTFGSLGSLNWTELKVLFIVLIAGTGAAFALSKPLNVWFLGENYARSLGVNISSARLWIIVSACLLTGAVTAFCGPLAFVGLAVPHLMKMLLQTHNHRILIPYVMIAGASLLLFCDILTKVPGSNQVLPINAVTALIGAPIVIWVILKNRIVD
jgi:iron complex transport system permease protein